MSQLSQAEEEAVALCHVVGLCVWGENREPPQSWGGSKRHGRLMSSPRLRGQVTSWPEIELGLGRGSLIHTHTHSQLVPDTLKHPGVQIQQDSSLHSSPHTDLPVPALDVEQTRGFCPVCTETGPYSDLLMSPEAFAI